LLDRFEEVARKETELERFQGHGDFQVGPRHTIDPWSREAWFAWHGRREHLDRHGVTLDDGYVVGLAFAEFELAKHADKAGWVVICRAHGTRTEATKAAGEKLGARKARAGWCKACAKLAK
jgi:hypothetical protein